MTDARLRLAQRAASKDENDAVAAWAYIRELERLAGISHAVKQDVVVPFRHYTRIFMRVDKTPVTIFDNRTSIDGMSFVSFPFTRDYTSIEDLLADIALRQERDPQVLDEYGDPDPVSWAYERTLDCEDSICGYAVIDASIVELLNKTAYSAGNDSAGDAISAFKVAFCASAAHRVVSWKYWLDDYDNQPNSGWKESGTGQNLNDQKTQGMVDIIASLGDTSTNEDW